MTDIRDSLPEFDYYTADDDSHEEEGDYGDDDNVDNDGDVDDGDDVDNDGDNVDQDILAATTAPSCSLAIPSLSLTHTSLVFLS